MYFPSKYEFIEQFRNNPNFLLAFLVENSGNQITQNLIDRGHLTLQTAPRNNDQLLRLLKSYINGGDLDRVTNAIRGVQFNPNVSSTRKTSAWVQEALYGKSNRQGAFWDTGWFQDYGGKAADVLDSLLGRSGAREAELLEILKLQSEQNNSTNNTPVYILIAVMVIGLGALIFLKK